jgi:hypothetical protein
MSIALVSPRIAGPPASRPRVRKDRLRSVALFLFGFGSTSLLIHFVMGFLLEAQMKGFLSAGSL